MIPTYLWGQSLSGSAAPPAPSGHRYWRINVTALNGDVYVGIAELGLTESLSSAGPPVVYPADATGSGTASSSTTYPGLPASAAFDNNVTVDFATSGAALPQWIKYDFGPGVTKNIVEIQMWIRGGAWGPAQAAKDWDFQWSDDDSSWTTAWSITNSTGWTAGETRYFDATGQHILPVAHENSANEQFWRVKTTAVDGGGVFALAELKMYTALSGTNQCSGGTAHASSTIEGNKDWAFDGTTNYWAATNITDAWIGYRFASAKTIIAIAVQARTTWQSQSPKDFLVQKWNGSSYTTIMALTGITGWTSGQTRFFDATGEITGW